MMRVRGDSINELRVNRMLGTFVGIVPLLSTRDRLEEAVRGMVSEKKYIIGDEPVFFVRMRQPLAFDGYRNDLAVLKPKNRGETTRGRKNPLAALLLIPDKMLPENVNAITDLAFVEWVVIHKLSLRKDIIKRKKQLLTLTPPPESENPVN
jgi:hypothetical protein